MSDDAHTPTERWMREKHPVRVAMRNDPHVFVPIGAMPAELEEDNHICIGSCVCDRCWQPKSDRVHRKAPAS